MKEISLWNPNTNRIIPLGKALKNIRKKLKEHFIDVINSPEEYDSIEVKNVDYIINKYYLNSEEIINDYESLSLNFIDDEIMDFSSNMKIYKKAYQSRRY